MKIFLEVLPVLSDKVAGILAAVNDNFPMVYMKQLVNGVFYL